MSYNLRSRYNNQLFSDEEIIKLLNKLNLNKTMTKYEAAEQIKNDFLISIGINPYNIMQGFAFEGINGELAELNSNYAISLEILGLINYIPTINKIKTLNGHIGYSNDGKPITLRQLFNWLEKNK